MVYPNEFCIGFCYWMLNTSWQTLTPPRLALITTVYNAAIAGTSVTSLEYNNFTQTTSWRLPFYESYIKNNTPFSLPPVGTCDFWFSPAGLRSGILNSFGNTLFNNQIQNLYDLNGGVASADQIAAINNPFLSSNIINGISLPSISCSYNSNQMLNISNASSFTNNISGYSLFVIARGSVTAANRTAVGFSTGVSAGAARLYLGINPSGQWLCVSRRLDADGAATLVGGDSTANVKIACFTMAYNNNQAFLYENGLPIASNLSMGSPGNTSSTNSVGVYFGGFNSIQTWPGILFDVLAFQTALSSSDVLTITEWLNDMRKVY